MNLILLRRQDVFEQRAPGERKDEAKEETVGEEGASLQREEEQKQGDRNTGGEQEEDDGRREKKRVSYLAHIKEKNARLHCVSVLKIQVR